MSPLTIFLCSLALTSAVTPCQQARLDSTGLPGAYVPTCNDAGEFMPSQCHGSTGHCWCANSDGVEILGTRRSAVEDRMDCASLPTCITTAHTARLAARPGSYIPQCDYDGSFSELQCHHSTGFCWCVDDNGSEIAGTKSRETRSCDTISKCFTEAHVAVLPGQFVPTCRADGSYETKQCHQSTGHCWCVDAQGSMYEGTNRGPTETQVDCAAIPACITAAHAATLSGAYVPTCEASGLFTRQQRSAAGDSWCVNADTGREVIGSRRSASEIAFDCMNLPECLTKADAARRPGLMGGYIPQCEEDGSYSPQQCRGSTGYCWCVSSDNTEIRGTKRGPTDEKFKCEALPTCLTAAHAARQRAAPGTYVPQCDDDGSYSTKQCHGGTGSCWCVDDEGAEILGSRRSATEDSLDCNVVPECLAAAHEARSSRMLGRYIPQCDQAGNYTAQQCHTSTGHCWCVSKTGREIVGTRRGPIEVKLSCEALPKCLVEAHNARVLGGLGRFIPQCEPDGSYSRQQCHGSTGHCWCVTEGGSEMLGTRRGPTESKMDCTSLSKCIVERATASELSASGVIGNFVPDCNQDGSYKSQQCHHGTGHCWCVAEDGAEILGTRRTASDERYMACEAIPSCLTQRHLASRRGLLGVYTPQCTASGEFETEQCHGSTGQCWCVDNTGAEILGTRRSAGFNRVFDCATTTPCLSTAHRSRTSGLIGAFIPQCDASGAYTRLQCHGSTGHCWCVNIEGVEVLGSRRTASEGAPDCAQSECVLAAQRARATGLLGAFVPQCDVDGAFLPKQCHSSTGHCWCVDKAGTEVLGSRVPAGSSTVDCTDLPACFSEAQAQRRSGRRGAFVPQCDSDGSYSSVQCHTSTGYCWCATAEGREIPDTRTRSRIPECVRSKSLEVSSKAATQKSSVEESDSSSSQSHSKNDDNNAVPVALGVTVGVAAVALAAFAVISKKRRTQDSVLVQ